MSPSAIDWPWLPLELIQAIFDTLWLSPLTSEERIHIMTALPLVNSRFLHIYLAISFKHAYIPWPTRISSFLAILLQDHLACRRSKYLSLPMPTISPNLACQSITIMHDVTGVDPHAKRYGKRSTHQQIMLEAHRLAVMITGMPYVPNLRVLRLEFLDASVLDVLDHLAFLVSPPRVQRLELSIHHERPITKKEEREIATWRAKGRGIHSIRCRIDRLSFPCVKDLVVYAHEDDMADVAEVMVPRCKGLEHLIDDASSHSVDILHRFTKPVPI